jgi:hypothetical protein
MTAEPDESIEPQAEGLISRILGWLRAGYPEGVPQQDYVALLGILRRVLTLSELDRVVHELAEEAGADDSLITEAMVQERIEDVLKGPAHAEEVSRVSARLAAAGWPLWSPDALSTDDDTSTVRSNVVTRVVDWLREGYPTGLPIQDFVPLVALLRRRLTDAEVSRVARNLIEDGTLPIDRVDLGTAISKVTSEMPSDEDVARVRTYLTAHGWPTDLSV